jgi:CheY-like chemotaxis protein
MLSPTLPDIEMPKMGGIECTGEIRKIEAERTKAQRIPIIAVTANARTAQIQEVSGCCPLEALRASKRLMNVSLYC